MFLILAIVFLLIWAFGSLVFHAVGGMIHLLWPSRWCRHFFTSYAAPGRAGSE